MMDRKRAMLNYISSMIHERLDLLEEFIETEVKLQETIDALPETQNLSAVVDNYRSVAENIENMLNDLNELEEKVLKSMNLWPAVFKTALLRATTHSNDLTSFINYTFCSQILS